MYPSSDYRDAARGSGCRDDGFQISSAEPPTRPNALRDHQAQPVYRYVFSHALENGGALLKAEGAWHGEDVLFVFGVLEAVAGYRPTGGELELSGLMQTDWSQFAVTGSPDASWPVYDTAESYLQLDTMIPDRVRRIGRSTATSVRSAAGSRRELREADLGVGERAWEPGQVARPTARLRNPRFRWRKNSPPATKMIVANTINTPISRHCGHSTSNSNAR